MAAVAVFRGENPMNLHHRSLVALVACLSTVAFAQWKEDIGFTRSDRTTLKLLEPRGFAVAVQTPRGLVNDTIPAVIELPSADAFVAVTVTAPTGASWSQKVEVKRLMSTEVRLAQAARGPAPVAARSRVGRVLNTFAACGPEVGVMRQTSVRADFVGVTGAVAVSVQADAATPRQQPEVPEGEYDVRAYIWNPKDRTWTFAKTVHTTIARDGFEVAIGCNGGEPVVVR